MAYKCAIGNRVTVPVKIDINNAGKNVHHSFSLLCERLSQDEISAQIDEGSRVNQVIKRITKGWEGQRLVLNEDDSPADFNEEALDVMLNVAGLHQVIWLSYMKEVGAKTKN